MTAHNTLLQMLTEDMQRFNRRVITRFMPTMPSAPIEALDTRPDLLGYRVVQFYAPYVRYVGVEYAEGVEWRYRLTKIQNWETSTADLLLESAPPLAIDQLDALLNLLARTELFATFSGGLVPLPTPTTDLKSVR